MYTFMAILLLYNGQSCSLCRVFKWASENVSKLDNNYLLQEAKKLMEEKFKTGTNKWFFSKLRF